MRSSSAVKSRNINIIVVIIITSCKNIFTLGVKTVSNLHC